MKGKRLTQYIQKISMILLFTILSGLLTPFLIDLDEVHGRHFTNPVCVEDENLVSNFNFECGKKEWRFYSTSRKSFFNVREFFNSDGKAALVKIRKLDNNIQLYQKNIELVSDVEYELSFRAKANRNRSISTFLHKHGKPYTNYGVENQSYDLTTNWEEYKIRFTSEGFQGVVKDARLRFWFVNDNSVGDMIWLDDVSIKEIEQPPKKTLDKNVYVLVYDPILHSRGGKKLSVYNNWTPYLDQAEEAIDFFSKTSDGYLNFDIVKTVEVNDVWLTKVDGFTYTEDEYLDVIENGALPHRPDFADYYQFLNDPELDICGHLNRGQIDELWIFGGPWFGFYESAMASNGDNPGFWVNGPTFKNTSCEKLLPVGIPGSHNFGHRAEATMSHVYGGWEQNRQSTRWDLFGLEGAHSPDFNEFGCGSLHYAPNSQSSVDQYNVALRNEAVSYCDAFLEIPDVTIDDLSSFHKTITCEEWGCNRDGYEMWWWNHLPRFDGVGSDGKLNNWWDYIFDPNIIISPTKGSFSTLFGYFPAQGPAKFKFDYSGTDYIYTVNVSTHPDMSYDLYHGFTSGGESPIIEQNPTKWHKYSCGRTLYWQVESSTGIQSPIHATKVTCEKDTLIFKPIPKYVPTISVR